MNGGFVSHKMFALLLSLLVAVAVAAPSGQPKLINIANLIQTKIIGSDSAVEKQFPYQVTFQYTPEWSHGEYRHFCGGSIISPRHILTAAHCFSSYVPDVVKAGKLRLDENEPFEQMRLIAKIDIHKKFEGNVDPYDIAIVTVDKPFEWSEYVKAIALPELATEFTGNMFLSGWGSISPNGLHIPNDLQYAELPLLSYEKCRSAVYDFIREDLVDIKNVCTGPLTGGHAACCGDSGGPLAQKDKNGEDVLVGIVAWGMVPCGSVGAPTVYTKVSVFVEWIERILSL